jgi:hypothetical protein
VVVAVFFREVGVFVGEQLHARLRPGLAPAGFGDATDFAGSVSRQPGPVSVAVRLLDVTLRDKPPSLSERTSAACPGGLVWKWSFAAPVDAGQIVAAINLGLATRVWGAV